MKYKVNALASLLVNTDNQSICISIPIIEISLFHSCLWNIQHTGFGYPSKGQRMTRIKSTTSFLSCFYISVFFSTSSLSSLTPRSLVLQPRGPKHSSNFSISNGWTRLVSMRKSRIAMLVAIFTFVKTRRMISFTYAITLWQPPAQFSVSFVKIGLELRSQSIPTMLLC